MLKVTSREYKVMSRSHWSKARRVAVDSLLDEIEDRAILSGVKLSGKLKSPEQKAIRYFAQGVDLSHNTDFDAKEKLEEEIAAVFHSRFSHSTTLTVDRENVAPPTTVQQTGKLFSVLTTLPYDDRVCLPTTKLQTVNGFIAHERAYKGVPLKLVGTEASVAIILWTKS